MLQLPLGFQHTVRGSSDRNSAPVSHDTQLYRQRSLKLFEDGILTIWAGGCEHVRAKITREVQLLCDRSTGDIVFHLACSQVCVRSRAVDIHSAPRDLNLAITRLRDLLQPLLTHRRCLLLGHRHLDTCIIHTIRRRCVVPLPSPMIQVTQVHINHVADTLAGKPSSFLRQASNNHALSATFAEITFNEAECACLVLNLAKWSPLEDTDHRMCVGQWYNGNVFPFLILRLDVHGTNPLL
mmetsp:Transcript_18593/g.41224  ORF Transcript_18593/g.41224 Transcript_18593/m.41224 type:complete len:239 (+) Transcript_18593:2351-3067(+)